MRDTTGRARTTARCVLSVLAAAAAIALSSAAQAGVPYPSAKTPAAVDLGVISAQHAPISVSVMLNGRDAAGAEALAIAQHTPGSAQYRQFLTPAQYQARFGPAPETIAAAVAYFQRAGLGVTVTGSVLKVTGAPAAVQAAFGVRLHEYEVAAHGGSSAYRFHAPEGDAVIPSAAVAASVLGTFGLDSRPLYRPLSHQSPAALGALPARSTTTVNTPDKPGHWTVKDLAQYYNVQPLYDAGVSGAGKTLGIVTLASFTPQDAFDYWTSLGLTVDPGRLTVVNVDGGPGAPDDNAGSDETTLDVEQSGGLAPGAKIVVYQAPNTDQGFVDAFAQAINDNTADSFSVSWGEWEWFETQGTVSTGRRGHQKQTLAAFNGLFLQAVLQGQSAFASSGDSGGYEPNNPSAGTAIPNFSKTLGVDAPASSAWITAAGGTTLPGTQVYGLPGGGSFPVTIASEQVWGWDYLHGLCAALGYDDVSCGIFPGGSGGGVSSYNKLPFYQAGVSGMRVTEADQTFTDETTNPPTDYVTLPAGFAGRNVPDVSLNADPETGYAVLYTSSASGTQSLMTYWGGTSFVAPQLNGIAALTNQSANGRVGSWNFSLYRLAKSPKGYKGSAAPLVDITAGDNWFYSGVAGYEPGAGVGVLNVANFVKAVTGQ